MADAASTKRHVVVIGGGITGLAAAHRLLPAVGRGDVAVTLLEAESRLGGKVQTANRDGLVVEEGPDSFLVRKPWAHDLCREIGLEDELVVTPPAHRRSFIYHKGGLFRLPAGVMNGVPSRLGPFLSSPLVSPAGKARALLDLVRPRVLPAKGADVSLGHLLRARLGNEVVDRLAEPLLSGIYAGGADGLSLEATFPQLRRQELEFRSLIRAARHQARQAALARAADPTADGPPPPVFVTLRDGLGTLIDRLAKRLAAGGAVVRTSAAVRTVERAGRGGYTVRIEGEELHADAVIVTVPAPSAARLLAAVAPEGARELGAIAYADVALVAFAYHRDAIRHPLDGTGFVVPRDEDLDITACTWVSSKWPNTTPADTVLLRAYLGHAGARVLERSDDELAATARRAIARSMGIEAEPYITHVIRTPQGLPQYSVGHLARLGRIEAALSHAPGLVVTGAAFRGVGLPDCVRQGREAADAVLQVAPAVS